MAFKTNKQKKAKLLKLGVHFAPAIPILGLVSRRELRRMGRVQGGPAVDCYSLFLYVAFLLK